MRPDHFTVIGSELAIKWSDGREDFIPLERLRRGCPCANCQGETDVLGVVHRPAPKPLVAQSFTMSTYGLVGGYGFQPRWADGHGTGIYSWEYLHRIASEPVG